MQKTDEVMHALATVQISSQTLESLDHFKQNDHYTYCHMLRVFALATLIAHDILPDTPSRRRFISMGPTHDVGKVSTPLMLLKKKGALTRNERKLIDHHTLAGYVMLSYFYGDPKHTASVAARDHHERRDASGTPRGIRLADRMVEIVIVCDIYDALISPRSYRPVAYDNRTAIEEITKIAEAKKIGWKAIRSLVGFNRKARPGQQVVVSLDKRGAPPAENYYGIFED
jgi:HD-GYP domain-containing protein (c-di-GMP phosphodiesterase class II)